MSGLWTATARPARQMSVGVFVGGMGPIGPKAVRELGCQFPDRVLNGG